MLTLFLAAFSSGLTTAAESADPALSSAKAVVEARCSLCHGIDRAMGKNKTPEEWSKTVVRMQNKAPDKISDADVKAILDYLNAVRGPK